MIYFYPIIFGILWRCRGGFIGLNSTVLARVLWSCIPYSIWMFSLVGFWGAVVTFIGTYLSALLRYSPFMADTSAGNLSGMAGIGIARLVLILCPLFYWYPWTGYMPLLGAFAGLCYYLGWQLHDKDSGIHVPTFSIFGKQIQGGPFAKHGTEWAEVFVGVLHGTILMIISYIIEFNGLTGLP